MPIIPMSDPEIDERIIAIYNVTTIINDAIKSPVELEVEDVANQVFKEFEKYLLVLDGAGERTNWRGTAAASRCPLCDLDTERV